MIVNSEAGRRHLGLNDADTAVVINNGIDTNIPARFSGSYADANELQIPSDVRIVGLVSRLIPSRIIRHFFEQQHSFANIDPMFGFCRLGPLIRHILLS